MIDDDGRMIFAPLFALAFPLLGAGMVAFSEANRLTNGDPRGGWGGLRTKQRLDAAVYDNEVHDFPPYREDAAQSPAHTLMVRDLALKSGASLKELP